VRALDRTAILSPVTTLEDQLAAQLSPRRFQTWLLGLFSTIALVLTSIGIYGVMHYAVARRTHELGIRMALGARAADVLRLVVGQGLRLALIGIAIGLAAAWELSRLLTKLLFGVGPDDVFTFVFVCFVLCNVAAIASLLPALRALQIDPLKALRHE
jgi:putative ABC transport system permease protein